MGLGRPDCGLGRAAGDLRGSDWAVGRVDGGDFGCRGLGLLRRRRGLNGFRDDAGDDGGDLRCGGVSGGLGDSAAHLGGGDWTGSCVDGGDLRRYWLLRDTGSGHGRNRASVSEGAGTVGDGQSGWFRDGVSLGINC